MIHLDEEFEKKFTELEKTIVDSKEREWYHGFWTGVISGLVGQIVARVLF